MKIISKYISEKLHLNKNINIESDVFQKICKYLQIHTNHNIAINLKKWIDENNIIDVDIYCDKSYSDKYFNLDENLKNGITILSKEDSDNYSKKYKKGDSLYDNGHVFMYIGKDYLSVYRRFGNLYFIAL